MSSIKRTISIGLILSCVFSLTPLMPSVAADTITGTLVGKVFDVSTACTVPDCPPLFGVLVQVRNDDKGYVRSVKSDSNGTYRLEFIEPGNYTIVGKLAGYNDDVIQNFRIKLDKPSEIIPPPLRLTKTTATPPPPVQTSPEAVVNSIDAAHRLNVDSETLLTLPLSGVRSFDTLAKLAPGVAPPPATYGAAGPGVGPGVGTSGQYAVNGLRSRSNNFTVDGSDNNDQDIGVRRQGFVSLVPQSVESIEEVEITTLLADAQAGRNFGAQVNAISRTGTNSLHGQIYDFFRSSQLARQNFFDTPFLGKDSLTSNMFGLVVGGPIKQDRTHFFVSYEKQDINRDRETSFAVPLLSQRRFLGFDPAQNPAGETQAGKAVLDLYPVPNNPGGPYGANTFSQVLNAGAHGNVGSVKIDHKLNDNNYFTGRYNITDDHSIIPSVGGAINGGIEPRTRTQNVSLYLISQLTSTSANQFRFSYGRTHLEFPQVSGSPFVFSSPTGLVDRDGDGVFESGRTGPIGQLLISPYSPIGVDVYHFPQARANNTFQFADTYTKSIVGHTFKAGADIRKTQFNSQMDRNFRPQIQFSGVFNRDPFLRDVNGNVPTILSGTDLAAMGAPTAIFQTIATNPADSTIGLRFTETDFFFMDSWNARRGLHVDLGVRYENNTVPSESQNRIENTFGNLNIPANDPTRNNPNDPTVAAALVAFNSAVSGLTSFLDGRTEIYTPDHNNFAPRVGFAWDPTHQGKMAIRAGYGIFYDQILGSVVSESRNVFPTFIPIDFAPSFLGFDPDILINPAFIGRVNAQGKTQFLIVGKNTLNQFGGQPGDLRAGIGALFVQSINGFNAGNGLAFTLPTKNLRTPYAQHYSISVEKELWSNYVLSASYVGTRGTKLMKFLTPNLGPAAVTFEIPDASGRISFASQSPKGARPDSRLGSYTVFDSSGNSSYNSLQVTLNRRFSNYLQFTTSYTYSHTIDDVSDVFDTTGAFSLPQNSFNLKGEKASSSFDIRHIFTASGVYDLSRGSENRFWGGWQLSGILTLQSGQPFTVNSSIDVNEDGNLTDRLNTLNGLSINDNGRTAISVTGSSLVSLLAPRGQDGAIGRNTFRARGLANLDLALIKRITIDDKRKLEFRTEIFNVFNRTDFGVPVRILEAPSFGQSVNTTLDRAYLQFALKFSF